MLDPAYSAVAPSVREDSHKVLHWRKNERMGGMVPVWESEPGPGEANATGKVAGALAYGPEDGSGGQSDEEAFGFGDLLDMINPLQHLPVVGSLYRELTGDEIRPIAKIIGGGVYGGVAGAAAGLVDSVVTYETGRSLSGNVVAMITGNGVPEYRSEQTDEPERRLAAAAQETYAGAEVPSRATGFAPDQAAERPVHSFVRATEEESRTAGVMPGAVRRVLPDEGMEAAVREPIGRVAMAPMPPPRAVYND